MIVDAQTRIVQEIAEDGQAEHLGIKVGMRVCTIDGEEFSEQLLTAKAGGSQDFLIAFDNEASPSRSFDTPSTVLRQPLDTPSRQIGTQHRALKFLSVLV